MTGDDRRGRRQWRRNLSEYFVKLEGQKVNVGEERRNEGVTENHGPVLHKMRSELMKRILG